MSKTTEESIYTVIDNLSLDPYERLRNIITQQAFIIAQQHPAVALCEELIHPDGFGHSVTQEVRQEAYRALLAVGLRPKDSSPEVLTKPVKVYLAGPMTGLPDYNYPAFFQAAELLRERGLIVENPAEHAQRKPQSSWEGYMRQAIKILMDCDEIYLLPDWKHSKGALIEWDLALMLNMPQHFPEDWCPQYCNQA